MMANPAQTAHADDRRKSDVALKTFFRITDGWGLSSPQQKVLLGDPPRTTFYKWRNGEGPTLSRDTLERISYVLGIYKALRILFPTEEQANAWPKKASRDFDGDSALDVMLKGSMINLADVRRYLDYMRG